MQGKYRLVFSIYCFVFFGLFIEADASIAKSIGTALLGHLKECKGAEHLSNAAAIKMLKASDLKESDQCLIECMLEKFGVVDKKSQLNAQLIKDSAKKIQAGKPKPGVDLGQKLLNCDYKPKDKVCLAGFKEHLCLRKVLESYLGEGLFY